MKPNKPRITWMRRFRCWVCSTPNIGDQVGLGFTPRDAFDHWSRLRSEEDGRSLARYFANMEKA